MKNSAFRRRRQPLFGVGVVGGITWALLASASVYGATPADAAIRTDTVIQIATVADPVELEPAEDGGAVSVRVEIADLTSPTPGATGDPSPPSAPTDGGMLAVTGGPGGAMLALLGAAAVALGLITLRGSSKFRPKREV